MSSVNQEYSRRVKEEKILRRQKKFEEKIKKSLINLNDLDEIKPVVKKEETVLVRARDEKGHYVKDDLSTPDVNEAWVEKPKKKKAGRPRKKV